MYRRFSGAFWSHCNMAMEERFVAGRNLFLVRRVSRCALFATSVNLGGEDNSHRDRCSIFILSKKQQPILTNRPPSLVQPVATSHLSATVERALDFGELL